MQSYLPLWLFIIFMVATPGPANLLLMSAGSLYGYVRLIPFLVGLLIGKLLINIAIALGLAQVMQDYYLITQGLTYISAALIIFLALRGWFPQKNEDKKPSHIFNWWIGILVHPLSPKSWLMATLAYTQFTQELNTTFELYILIPLSFLVVQFTFHSIWCLAGALLKSHISYNLLLTRTLIVLTVLVVIWALFY